MTEVHPRVEASDRVERPQTPQRAEDDEPRSVSPAGIIPDQSASTKRGRSEETEAASESDKRQRPEVDIADSDSSRTRSLCDGEGSHQARNVDFVDLTASPATDAMVGPSRRIRARAATEAGPGQDYPHGVRYEALHHLVARTKVALEVASASNIGNRCDTLLREILSMEDMDTRERMDLFVEIILSDAKVMVFNPEDIDSALAEAVGSADWPSPSPPGPPVVDN